MRIVIASNNEGKVKEFNEMFLPLGIECVSLKKIGLDIDVVEDGETFEENATKKALTICNILKEPCLADDSGLMVDFLDGQPGVYSARYSGPGANAQLNNEKLLEMLKDVPFDKRTARFVCTIVIAFPDGRQISSRGECEGVILTEKRGYDGFGYDPLFYYPPYKKSFGELSSEEKHKVSHRGKALRDIIDKLRENI